MASTVLPNGIIVPEKFSRDWYADLYHNWQELDNLLGGGTPKDGTLTIQKNGDTVGTFSANQSTDETVNIEVPTATSELTNDSGFITGVSWNDVTDKPSFATVATSGSYDDLSNKPTIPTVNDATLTIQQNSVTVDTFTANSSSDKTVNIQCVDLSNNQTIAGNKEFTGTTTAHDLVPSATDTYNFGSPNVQWNNAYIKSLTINGVACGDILTHNASEFVDVSSNQTIGGNKEFTDLQTIRYGTRYKGSKDAYILPEFSAGYSGLSITTLSFAQTLKIGNFALGNNNKPVLDTSKAYIQVATGEANNVNACLIEPRNCTSSSFGTSTNKWKTINGINPGALSLPSTSSGINLDLTNFKTDGSDNKFRLTSFSNYPYDNGWLFIKLSGCTSYYLDHWYKVVSNSYTTPCEAIFFLPINDKEHDITLRCVCTSISYIRVFPCQGNV